MFFIAMVYLIVHRRGGVTTPPAPALAPPPVVGPTSAAAGGDDYEEEITLEKAYELIGLLITESRLPDNSTKGRREGDHLPLSQSSLSHKSCLDYDTEVCRTILPA